MSRYRIAVIGGDGVGPEVLAEALKVVSAVGVDHDAQHFELGATHYVKTGEVLPDETLAELAGYDAILLGAVGPPIGSRDVPPGILERGLLLRLRFELDLYINLRPFTGIPGAIAPRADLVVVRENTEGPYAGEGGALRRGTPQEVATQGSVNTRFGVERCVRFAFELAETRPRKAVTLVHKTNVLTFAGDLWQRTFDAVAAEHPSVETSYQHVDAASIYLVIDADRYDVIVTDNLFGDILTDLAGAVTGGIGYAASANLNPARTGPSMFEPVHGSAHDIVGTGKANPLAAIKSAAMMLEHLGELDAAARISKAALAVQDEVATSAKPFTTSEIGDAVVERLWSAHTHHQPHSAHPGHEELLAGALPSAIDIYDTTLRDGSQQELISLTVEDKLRVARQLDHLGVAYIEGGWPGANPKDEEFFRRAKDELKLETATLVAFGSTRHPGGNAAADATLANLVDAGTAVVCIVAKSAAMHVREALRTDLDEALAMVRDSVDFLRAHDLRVFLDAEHFFDGMQEDRDFSLRVLDAAESQGAEALILCDTNGGTLPYLASEIVEDVRAQTSCVLGVHFHNDSGCAVANSLAAVAVGATQVQGCVNGYGERAGNADLSATIPNLTLKMGVETIPRERIELITPVARHIAELVNINLDPQKPYVGGSAFTHKAGLHTSANARWAGAYEHVRPDLVGNGTRVVVSELSGRSTLAMKAAELGIEVGSVEIGNILDTLKQLESAGYHFEVADGSLELLMLAAAGAEGASSVRFFSIESFRVITDWVANDVDDKSAGEQLVHPWGAGGRVSTEATIRIRVGNERLVATAEGNGPVNALDSALRQALGAHFPELSALHLTDYRVRVLDSHKATGAVTRVLLDTTDANGTWSTMGVSENIIEASWQALVDSIVYGLLRAARRPGQE